MVLKLIREVIRVGEATVLYPFVPVEVAPGFRGKPQYDPELCIACAACTIACPSNALTMQTDAGEGIRTWQIFYGRCIFCARCEEVCPTGAITLGQDFELAVMNREDLLIRADFRLAACCSCGAYFAPQKELEYVASLLKQAGQLADVDEADRRALLEMCPACRRTADVPLIERIYQEAA
jgi:hydrogenase-4 component H